jgi:cytosolic carboxypeptidase protein 2/3
MGKTYYTLTFTYDFDYDNDSVFFAYSVPYTYTDLLDDIVAIEMDPARGG